MLRVSEVEALVDAALQETFGKMKQGESAEHARRLGEYFATLDSLRLPGKTTLEEIRPPGDDDVEIGRDEQADGNATEA